MMRILLGAAALLAAPAFAQMPTAEGPAPVCVKAEIVPGFEAFGGTGGTALTIGRPATLALTPAARQTFTPPLGRKPDASSFGGTFPLTIGRPGTYRIALSTATWIDVIGDGHARTSIAHTPGPPCSGIKKIVDFALEAGTYQVQLSATKEMATKVMVIGG